MKNRKNKRIKSQILHFHQKMCKFLYIFLQKFGRNVIKLSMYILFILLFKKNVGLINKKFVFQNFYLEVKNKYSLKVGFDYYTIFFYRKKFYIYDILQFNCMNSRKNTKKSINSINLIQSSGLKTKFKDIKFISTMKKYQKYSI